MAEIYLKHLKDTRMYAQCYRQVSRRASSVTRFSEISPLWQNIKKTLAILEGSFSVWKNIQPTLVKCCCKFGNFQCCKWPNIVQIIQPSGHTGPTFYSSIHCSKQNRDKILSIKNEINLILKKCHIPGLFLFIFGFSLQLTVGKFKILLMTGFELRTSVIGSNRSTN